MTNITGKTLLQSLDKKHGCADIQPTKLPGVISYGNDLMMRHRVKDVSPSQRQRMPLQVLQQVRVLIATETCFHLSCPRRRPRTNFAVSCLQWIPLIISSDYIYHYFKNMNLTNKASLRVRLWFGYTKK